MASKKKSGILFLLGAAVGAAAGYYLNTESGKKLRTETSKKASELAKKAEIKSKDGIDQLKTGLDQALEKSKDVLSEAKETVKSKIKSIEEQSNNVMDSAESAYHRGAEEARAKINQKAREIEDLLESKGA